MSQQFIRRNRVDERAALAIGVVGGIVVALAGLEPTGVEGVDSFLTFIAALAVVWSSASAPWWVISLVCGVGASIALDPVIAVAGFVGLAVALFVGLKQRSAPELRAVSAGLAVNALARSELEGFHGLSAILGVAACAILLVVGLSCRPSVIRRPGWIVLGSLGGAAVVAVIGVAVAAIAARPDVSSGAEMARRALTSLNSGDYDGAAQLFDDAAASFEAASDSLGGPLALPGRLVPVVSQNVRAGAFLSETAASSLRLAAASLREVDPANLAVRNGVIDVDAVRAVEAPLVTVQAALEDLQATSDEVASPWLVPTVQKELDELDADFERQELRLQNAVDAVRVAPGVLGAGGSRRYLILFTTPSEARGLGGFVGNYAELTIDNGKIEVGDFDRRSDLEDVVRAVDVRCDRCPEEFLAIYGRYGFTTGDDGGVGDRGWSNITMPAHFPHVAEVASILYPQSGGTEVDGVILMDPYVLATLVKYTGPIEVPEFGVTVEAQNAADFILREQYLLAGDDANPNRIDALDTLGNKVIDRLLTSSLPEPAVLAEDLAPLVSERRLLFWAADEAEQNVFDRIGLLGSIPELSSDDGGFSVSVTNAGASKIDVYLERATEVEISVEGDRRVLRAEVTLTNTAPSSGLPRYVIGNSVGLPEGWSRLIVAFYGPPGLSGVLRDGEPADVTAQVEAGWFRHSLEVDLAPGASTDFVLEFGLGPVDPSSTSAGDGSPPEPIVFVQPLAAR